MKKLLVAALAASLSSLHAADAPNVKSNVSYSIGVNIANNLKKQGIDVERLGAPALADQEGKAWRDAGLGYLRMTDAEMDSTMQAFSTEMRTKMQDKQKKAADENKAKGEAFLTRNKGEQGWKTTKSGLQYKVITEGKGVMPKATDTVKTNYSGKTIDGHEFDSSYKRNEPAEFPVGQVIPGWTEALQMMPVGSKWQLAIPSTLAYGESAPPEIGPNSVLLFDIELLDIVKAKDAGDKKPDEETKK